LNGQIETKIHPYFNNRNMEIIHINGDGHTSFLDSMNGELQLIKVDESLISDVIEFLNRKDSE